MHSLIHRTTAAALALGTLASAQGTYTVFGNGCPGSPAVSICANSNGAATVASGQCIGFRNDYALEVPNTAQAVTVVGFELLTQATQACAPGPSILPVAILDSDPAGRPGTVLATSSLVVGNNMGWHRATLAAPLTITTRRPFFLMVKGNQTCLFPVVATALNPNPPYYLKSPTSAAWNGAFTALRWAWRVLCLGPRTPSLSITGLPTINTSFSLDLSAARPSAPCLLFFGLRAKRPPPVPLPGAPGCLLLVSPDFQFGGVTNGAGAYSLTIPLPNNPRLIGIQFDNQYLVNDPANALRLVVSNAGQGTIG